MRRRHFDLDSEKKTIGGIDSSIKPTRTSEEVALSPEEDAGSRHLVSGAPYLPLVPQIAAALSDNERAPLTLHV
jgi:hypothetical protein